MADALPPGRGSVRPTVLVVGDDEPMDEAICAALDHHGLDVERVPTLEAVEATRLAAPDLVLLVGDAARASGETVLARMAQNPLTQLVPVALLSDDRALGERLAAFRHGAVAVVPRTASVDEMARKVADIAHEMPERQGEQTGELGEATFDELMKLVKQELRSGILSVETGSSDSTEGSTAFRLVLGAGKPVAKAVAAFVAQLRPLVSKAEPMRYELLEHAGARFGLLDSETGGTSDGDAHLAALRGLRVLLVVLDPARADALASELRSCGAVVAVADASGRGLERARGLDPEVVIIDAAGIEGPGFAVVKACRRDPRLRWASMLVAHWEELWPEGAASPDMARLASRLAPLIEPDRSTAERARTEASFDMRLELIGPSRLLRALARVEPTLHVTVRNPRCVVDVDLSQGLVVGAIAKRQGDAASVAALEGQAALAALLALGSGRVRIERRTNPQTANVMAPVEEALAMAAGEEPPLPPSIPPPSLVGGLAGLESGPPPAEPLAAPAHAVPAMAVPVPRALSNAFDEAPTATHAPLSPGAGKRTLVGLPSGAARPSAKSVGAPAAPLRPKTMLGLAPMLRAPIAEAAAPAVAIAAPVPLGFGPAPGTLAAESDPHAHGAPLPAPARVPIEAVAAAAGSPAQTVPPVRRAAATMMGMPPSTTSHLSPALSATQPAPTAPAMASTMPGPPSSPSPEPIAQLLASHDAAVETSSPLAYDSFVIPEANVIPGALVSVRPPVVRSSVLPRLAIGAAAVVLLGISIVAAALLLPRLFAPTSPHAVLPPQPVPPVTTPVPPHPVAAPGVAPLPPAALPPALHDAGAPRGLVAAPSVERPLRPEPPSVEQPLPPPPAEPRVDATDEESHPDTELSPGDRLVVRANRTLVSGDMRHAEVIYLQALALESRNPHALAGLARLHIARRAGRQALSYAERAVAVRPHRAAYRVVLGDALGLLGRRGEAQRAYRDALRMDPRSREARARLRGGR